MSLQFGKTSARSVDTHKIPNFRFFAVNKSVVESGDELPDAVEMNKTLDRNHTTEMDIDDTELDNNNNTSSSKMGS